MYSLKNVLTKKPAEIAGAVITLVNLSTIVGFVTLSADAIAGLNIALLSVLGLFVAGSVTSNASLTELEGIKADSKAEGVAEAVEILAPPATPSEARLGGAAAGFGTPTGTVDPMRDADYPPTETGE